MKTSTKVLQMSMSVPTQVMRDCFCNPWLIQVLAAGSFGFSKVHQNNLIGVKGWNDDENIFVLFSISQSWTFLMAALEIFCQAGLSKHYNFVIAFLSNWQTVYSSANLCSKSTKSESWSLIFVRKKNNSFRLFEWSLFKWLNTNSSDQAKPA